MTGWQSLAGVWERVGGLARVVVAPGTQNQPRLFCFFLSLKFSLSHYDALFLFTHEPPGESKVADLVGCPLLYISNMSLVPPPPKPAAMRHTPVEVGHKGIPCGNPSITMETGSAARAARAGALHFVRGAARWACVRILRRRARVRARGCGGALL